MQCGKHGGMGYHSGHWYSISLVGPIGMVGLSPSYVKLHIVLINMSDVSRPVLREVLGAQNILEFLMEATIEGSPFRGIIPL
jgi:hypothetical protein